MVIARIETNTLCKTGLLRSKGKGRGRKHTFARASTAPSRSAAAKGKRDPATRSPRRKRDDDEDRPAPARASSAIGDRRAFELGREAEAGSKLDGRGASGESSSRAGGRQGPVLSAEQLYAAAISGHHLLTAAEELALARRLEEVEITLWERLLDGPLGGEARRRLLALEQPIEPSSAREARAADLDRLIASRVIAGDEPAGLTRERAALRAIAAEADRIRDRLVTCNLRLVPSTIRRHNYHRTTSLAMGDLIQEGNFGLLKATPRFDYRRGLRFSTFATWWIRHYLGRARQNFGAEVRVPVHMQELASKVRGAAISLRRELGRDPDQSEIASVLKVPKKTLQTLEGDWLKYREALPVFDSVGEDGSIPSYLASDAALADEILSRHQENDQLAAMIAHLPPLLIQIVRRRFGLGGIEPETLIQIGESMKLSRERIRQLEKKALSILRQAFIEVTDVVA